MELVTESINNTVKQGEHELKLRDFGAQVRKQKRIFIFVIKLIFFLKTLLNPNRKLLHEGILTDNKNKKIHILLFSDIIVHMTETKAKKSANFKETKYQVSFLPIYLL